MYQYQPYPKWVYHRELKAKIVKDEKEHKALGADWGLSPADFEKPEEPKPVKPLKGKSKE